MADLAFHDGPVRAVVLLPGRVLMTGFCALQRGFMGVDADHPSPAGFRALRPQWTRRAEGAEAGRAVTRTLADAQL